MIGTPRGLHRLSALCAAVLALSAGGAVWAQPAQPPTQAQAAGRTILVMIRLSPDHYRPNDGYGGAYGDRLAIMARRRIAAEIARRHGLSMTEEGWPMPLVGLDCYVMSVPTGRSVEQVVAEVSRDAQVLWSQPVQTFEAQGGGDRTADPLLAVQPAAKAWCLTDLHKVATGRGVAVAVVDSRVEVNHPDLAGQFVANEDFVLGRPGPPERHGTAVAGVIAAKEGNGIGIAGIAPDARLMALRACWQTDGSATVCDSLSLAKALHFAIDHNAGVINLSLAGPQDRLLSQLIAVAARRRIAVVAAFDQHLPQGGFPASEPGVIPVAMDSLAVFPPGVYGAPGTDVPTTQPGGKWFLVNGSSYAAAHVSGLIALVREDRPPADRPMLVSARPASGAVDACATLLRASKACNPNCPVTAQSVPGVG
jgi:subtilisin family serine protease